MAGRGPVVRLRTACRSAALLVGNVRVSRRPIEVDVVRPRTTASGRVRRRPSQVVDDLAGGLPPVGLRVPYGGPAPTLRPGVDGSGPIPRAVLAAPTPQLSGERLAAAPVIPGRLQRSVTTPSPGPLRPVRRSSRPAKPRSLLVTGERSRAPLLTAELPVKPKPPSSRSLVAKARPPLAAIHATASGVILATAVPVEAPTPEVRPTPLPTVVVSAANVVRVGVAGHGVSLRAAVPASTAQRRTAPAPASGQVVVVGANRP